MDSKSLLENLTEIKNNISLYLETKLSLYALIAFEKSVKAIMVFLSNTTILIFLMISLLFFSAAGALYLGKLIENPELGLIIVGGAYLLLALIFVMFKKQIFSRLVINYLSHVFFKDDDDDEPLKNPPKS